MTKEQIITEGLKWHNALIGFVQGLLRDWNLAEDAVQQAYLIAYQKAESFDPDAPVFPWLRGIVRLKCLEIIRERSRIKAAPDDQLSALIDQRMSEHWNEDYIESKRDREQALRHCLGKLRPKALSMLTLFYRDKVSSEELSKKFSRSINSLYVTLSRTRQKIRECCIK